MHTVVYDTTRAACPPAAPCLLLNTNAGLPRCTSACDRKYPKQLQLINQNPLRNRPQSQGAHPVKLLGEPRPYWQVVPIPNSKEKPARIMPFCPFPGGRGRQTEDGVPKRMMPSFLCLLSYDALPDHACVFLFVSMHLEAELPTQEDIPTQCGMATQDKMVTQ